jgi:hypothetical protein
MMLDLFDEPVLPGLRLCRPDIFAGGLAFASPNTSPTVRLRRKDWSRIGVPDTSDTIAANSARDEDGSGMTKSKSARSEADATRISRARHDLGFPGWCDRKPSSRLHGMDQRIAVVASLTTPIAAEHVEERNGFKPCSAGVSGDGCVYAILVLVVDRDDFRLRHLSARLFSSAWSGTHGHSKQGGHSSIHLGQACATLIGGLQVCRSPIDTLHRRSSSCVAHLNQSMRGRSLRLQTFQSRRLRSRMSFYRKRDL